MSLETPLTPATPEAPHRASDSGASSTPSLPPAPLPCVAVCTVSYNSAAHLPGWWAALRALPAEERASLRVIAVDCASEDHSRELLEDFGNQHDALALKVVRSSENLGFAGGMNLALAQLEADDRWVLCLNPDARPLRGSIPYLVDSLATPLRTEAGHPEGRVGSVTGRLVRPEAVTGELAQGPVPSASATTATLDACGMVWTRAWRHFDRGSGEPNDGRYARREEVFAGTGAGTLYAVDALRDVALPAESAGDAARRPAIFDEDFHSFREDAELGLRLQRRGWRCIYEPRAVIEHLRHNLPERRKEMSAAINLHSLKNRYLLRILHQSPLNALRTPHAWFRDLGILGYVLLHERSSLPAYSWLWRNRRRLLRRRAWLKQQQTANHDAVERWFRHQALPLPPQRAPSSDL